MTTAVTRTRRRSVPGGGVDARARLVLDSPIGPLLLAGDPDVLTHLFLPNTGMASHGTTPGPAAALHEAASQLEEYFAGARRTFELPLAPAGTPFQMAVWQTLAEIPYGETISYAELARWVGRPGAFRAVGQANGANPLPIVYPCHRVVAAGGRLGGYGGGIDVKRRLLDLEGSKLASAR
jgi:methylated-DNA-[protein]-cysteine S-methyltransferase